MIRIEQLNFTRRDGDQKHSVLKDLSLTLEPGEQLALLGDSGSGKTTLLHLLAGLLKPDSGLLRINQQELTGLSQKQLALYRRSIGLIFQQHQLLAPLTVADNILFQYRLNEGKKNSKQAAKSVQQEKQALQILAERLGIAHKLHALPHQLSGGEQQRVGIARALIHQPQLILADEPTGNLDQERSIEVVKLMTALCKERNINLIMVTHSQQLAHYFERVLYLKAGCLEEMPRPSESFF
jgi:ABC-type lipoprotein export system ATPase subunit